MARMMMMMMCVLSFRCYLHDALQEVKANSIREGNTAKAEDLGDSINDRIKSVVKNFVC